MHAPSALSASDHPETVAVNEAPTVNVVSAQTSASGEALREAEKHKIQAEVKQQVNAVMAQTPPPVADHPKPAETHATPPAAPHPAPEAASHAAPHAASHAPSHGKEKGKWRTKLRKILWNDRASDLVKVGTPNAITKSWTEGSPKERFLWNSAFVDDIAKPLYDAATYLPKKTWNGAVNLTTAIPKVPGMIRRGMVRWYNAARGLGRDGKPTEPPKDALGKIAQKGKQAVLTVALAGFVLGVPFFSIPTLAATAIGKRTDEAVAWIEKGKFGSKKERKEPKPDKPAG